MRVYEVRLRIEADDDCRPEHIKRELHDGCAETSFSFDIESVDPKFSTFADVYRLAQQIHAGQKDKIGVPYIEHVHAVALGLEPFGLEVQMVGLLHDSIEDGEGWTAERLRNVGIQSRVVAAVEAVTNVKGETYSERISRITKSRWATLTKVSDNAHNSREDRLAKLDQETRARLRGKYYKARQKLWAAVEKDEIRKILEIVNPDLLGEL